MPRCVTEAKRAGRSVFPSVQLILVRVDPVPFFIPCCLFTSEFQLHVWPSWCSKQVKKHHSSAQAGNYHLALDAACRDSLPMKRKTVAETLTSLLFSSTRSEITLNPPPPQLCAHPLHPVHHFLPSYVQRKVQKKVENENKCWVNPFWFIVAWNYLCSYASTSHIHTCYELWDQG